MGFIGKIYYFFTPYTDGRERSVGLFFKKLSEHSNQAQSRSRLQGLLQQNAAVINLWTEYRYKGYKYLNKLERNKLYANLQLITEDFDRIYSQQNIPADTIASRIRNLVPHATPDPERARFLYILTNYFLPARGLYEYRESSSFGRLLQNPSHEKLIGDCNQIVTLYIYLYSRYYDVRDLQLRKLPGHVALHYNGIDIEATNATFANYSSQKDSFPLSVEEIVSINLLDTTDSYLSTHEIDAEDFLHASRLAFILSHNRDLVTRSLQVAYGKLVNSLMQRNNYNQAQKFAAHSRDIKLLEIVGNNGALYELGRHNYAAARRFAQYAPKRDELIRNSWHLEGNHHYEAHRYHDAIKAFEHVSDQTLVQRCYEALFFEEQKKLGSLTNAKLIKQQAATIKKMHSYAKKSGAVRLITYTDKLMKYL